MTRDDLTCLIIEDSLSTRMILCKAMEELGFTVGEAENGQVALEILDGGAAFALALVDWNMPVMNGLQFVRELQNRDEHRAMRLLMCTTRGELSEMLEALDTGANDYLIKPFSQEELQEKLRLLGFSL